MKDWRNLDKMSQFLKEMAIKNASLFSFCTLLSADVDLDKFLKENGYYFTSAGTSIQEGYITPGQRRMFVEGLKEYAGFQKIAEIGFNAGHTSEIFLESARNSKVVSFDINQHFYTKPAADFMQAKYGDRFQFVEGDSQKTVKAYFKAHPDEKFDLIYIDGCHLFDFCMNDIINCKSLAHKDTVLWIDDADFIDVKRAVEMGERLKILQVDRWQRVEDEFGQRSWVEAHYLFR